MWTVHAFLYVAAFALVLFEAATIRRRWDDWLGVVREIRWWMWPLAVATVLAVAATAGLLWQIPGMSWGWARAVGISTNALLTPADVDHVSASQDGASGVALLVGALVFLAAFAAAVPLLALGEERSFRAGLHSGDRKAWRRATLVFGLEHCFVGVPIAIGVALSWGGYVFGRVYLAAWNRRASSPSTPSRTEAACRAAAATHSVYNLLIVGVLLAFVVVKFGR